MALISIPVTFAASTQLPAASLNSNNTAIYNDYNGNITNANIAAAAAITLSKLNLNAFAFNLQGAALNTWASGNTGDTVPRLTMNSDGELVAGPGGAGALDIGLRRSAINTWQFYVPGGGTPQLIGGAAIVAASLSLTIALPATSGGTGLLTSGVDATKFLRSDGAGGFVMATPAGGGDVVGPAGATDNSVALFDGVTGKLLKDGVALGTAGKALISNGAGVPPSFQPVTLTIFTSADQAIVVGGLVIVAHGLGGTPTRVWFSLVNQIAEGGWVPGEIVLQPGERADGPYGVGVYTDAVNVNLRYSNNANVFYILNKATGAGVAITPANWKMRVYAALT